MQHVYTQTHSQKLFYAFYATFSTKKLMQGWKMNYYVCQHDFYKHYAIQSTLLIVLQICLPKQVKNSPNDDSLFHEFFSMILFYFNDSSRTNYQELTRI